MKLVLVNLCNELKNETYGHVFFGRVTKNEIEKSTFFFFFFNFRKFGSVGSVKRKIKKLWPYCAYRNSVNNAILRLLCYLRTDRTMTIKI